ncbi:VanZ family protein [Planococcus sp. CP5-4]|uniref:VanZ family protein n=1 Tax=unclassified Planococcus (in: firmicutes) TaxID=2662419 RepID=UPI001C24595A|nr:MULTISPECIES: VanZ family protein [unclassified Planococcus (in: firmicutes)]MBU9673870.1 VanZ family protein [Planococcus sp. CP5-4_YE]MBV0909740.1 VanZ family protein [Planococcus sp. CP5-4_UN]MBW6065224.1 VanZ family protein [Planococcus sp. CP5-4]
MKKQLLAWLWPALWMVLIFTLSHQPAGVSGGISSEIVRQVFQAVASVVPVEFETLHTLFRKSAHFFAYLVLGLLFMRALLKNGMTLGRAVLWAFALSALYAASDEVHQLFITGRSGEIRDVLIDSAGATTGLLCYWLFAKIKWQHDKKAETNW